MSTSIPGGTEGALTRARVETVLADSGVVSSPDGPYLRVLRWLVWLPLLSIAELARIMQKDEQTVWHYLSQLGKWDLVARVLLSEPGWPPRHRRYYITDLGLYVLVACHPRPLSAAKLAKSYAIERADLLARLARPQVHLVLSDLVSRLLSECPEGYQLTSYQQPWRELYRWEGTKHTFYADAALLLRGPQGTEHAFYVLVDQPERLFSQRRERAHLEKLLQLRQACHLQREVLPHLLLLSAPARFSFWAELLEYSALAHSGTLFSGAIADYGQLSLGVEAKVWLPLRSLVSQLVAPHEASLQAQTDPGGEAVSLFSLLDQEASPQLIERISQRCSFERLLAECEVSTPARGRRKLSRYVGGSLQQEASRLVQGVREERSFVSGQLRASLHSSKQERVHAAALLNLALSAQQEALLALLVRHPVPSLADLMLHLQPESDDPRAVRHEIELVRDLELVRPYPWRTNPTLHVPWRERERYEITELGARFLAMRHGVSPARYLHPLPKDGEPPALGGKLDRRKISPLDSSYPWIQRGLRELKGQLPHTNSLYRAIRHIVAAGRRTGRYEIVLWKSARESVRWCFDRFDQKDVFAKPDAELLYRVAGSTRVRSLLIEYDLGTTFSREYQKKFSAYAAYQRARHTALPPIVMITPSLRSAERIRRSMEEGRHQDVHLVILLEQEVLQRGLLPVLEAQDPPL